MCCLPQDPQCNARRARKGNGELTGNHTRDESKDHFNFDKTQSRDIRKKMASDISHGNKEAKNIFTSLSESLESRNRRLLFDVKQRSSKTKFVFGEML